MYAELITEFEDTSIVLVDRPRRQGHFLSYSTNLYVKTKITRLQEKFYFKISTKQVKNFLKTSARFP